MAQSERDWGRERVSNPSSAADSLWAQASHSLASTYFSIKRNKVLLLKDVIRIRWYINVII